MVPADASAVVSGGASGLGLATVRALVGRGFRVVAVDLPSDEARERVGSAGATLVESDVLDEVGVRRAIAEATAGGCPLRVAVCCAGIATPGRVLSRGRAGSMEAFERVLRVNVTGTFNVVRYAAEAMAGNEPLAGDRGVMALTASVASFDGQVGQVAYSASKAGIAGMVPLARDLADIAVRVIAIAPGTFEAHVLAGLPADAVASVACHVPHLSRIGDPCDFAGFVGHIGDNGMLKAEIISLNGLNGARAMAPQ